MPTGDGLDLARTTRYFRLGFARAVIETMSTRRGGRVMDPFCGRGTALQVRDHVTDLHNLVEHPLEIATNLRQRKNSID